jgi:hypothetical protein
VSTREAGADEVRTTNRKRKKMKKDSIAGLIDKMRAEIEKADKFLEVAQKIEEEDDYSDAMLSMDRTYAEGFADALGLVLSILKGTI